MPLAALDYALAGAGAFLLYKFATRPDGRPLPPGPKRLPLIGNLLDMPQSHAWKTFAKWGEEYGDIVSVDLLGTRFVIINNPDAAVDLLNKRARNTSDRPSFPMANDLVGWDQTISNLRSEGTHKEYRKLVGRIIGTRNHVSKFDATSELQATLFLRRLLESHNDVEQAIRTTALALILALVYGYKVKESQGVIDDPVVALADQVLAEFGDVTRPGAHLVDVFPILEYVPAWFPGAGFQKKALRHKANLTSFIEMPWDFVKKSVAAGEDNNSYAANLLREGDLSEQRIHEIKWSAGSFYAAGSDTTVSIILNYFLAACKYPEVQKKAQAEIDAVIGTDRLPTLNDRPNLPYVEALVSELYRWLPVAPLALPHRAVNDDVYNGVLIPKDATIFANVWWFFHNEANYKDAYTFNPERFLGPNPERNPREIGAFGFGRRSCPGEHLAEVSVWISVTKAIAAFHIEKALDAQGNPIEPIADSMDGIISRPYAFACVAKPRSEQVVHIIDEDIARLS
ncbi:cytochrome P450 [Schizophyllum amplum]|uniref:Cytochrome P450 n=1 Tax=Schizophyllum amplum TaxID=97359 RepID=A0A550BWL7_9AGAR|nr:cytochrome P450 [Auriculariopsis ampla]